MTLIPNYFASAANDQALQVSADGTDLVSEVGEVTQQEVTLSDETLAASVDETNQDDTAQQTETTTLLPEEVQAVENGDAAADQGRKRGRKRCQGAPG